MRCPTDWSAIDDRGTTGSRITKPRTSTGYELLHDEKEIAEHVMLVDSAKRRGRGRTRGRCGSIARPIERYSHSCIWCHTSRATKGRFDAFDAFDALFSGGHPDGRPQGARDGLIDEFERYFRGPYAERSATSRSRATRTSRSPSHGVATRWRRDGAGGGGVVADSSPSSSTRSRSTRRRTTARTGNRRPDLVYSH